MAGSGLEANGSAAFTVLVGVARVVGLELLDDVVDTSGALLDDELVGNAVVVIVAGAAVDCVAIALMDELSSAVGGVGVAAAAGLFSEDPPPNGAKKSRLKAAWLRLGLNKNGPSALTLQ